MTDQRHAPAADPGFVLRFQDNREPAVDAGRYRVKATQTLPGVVGDTGDYLKPVEEIFEVRAPQFALADEQVHAANPAPEARSDYSTTLAHLTLTDPLLPWMRRLDEPGALEAPPAEPWLALLLFAAGELPGDPESAGLTVPLTAEQLLADAPGVRHPRVRQIEGDPTAICHTVEIPGDVFTAVVPRTDELRHLTHVREVRTDAGLRGEQLAEGTYAVVLANRLPDREHRIRYAAHLVALEGCRSILADADAGRLTAGVRIRLAALRSWSFLSDPAPGGGFPGRVRHFLFDQQHNERDLLLRVPQPPPEPPAGADPAAYATARARLVSGRVPLTYGLETGERSCAWYRGPFTAEPAQPLPAAPAAGWTSAAQLMAYEKAWGLFDAGWGAAWTLGRALALADADFAAMLTAWHAKARTRAAALAQRLAAVGLDVADSGDARALTPRPFGTLLEELAAGGAAARLLRAGTHPDGSRHTPPPEPFHRAPAAGRRGAGRAARTAELLADPPDALRTALTAQLADAAAPISAWLQRLRLLHTLPFADLVPDERALPAESLRLFYVDQGWLTGLVSGAAGIALTGETDAALARIAAPWNRTDAQEPTPRAGVLIRSALVHECPGLLVRPYRGHGEGRTPLAVLRQDALGPDVLLVLFEQVPDEVELAEPPEGLSFGIDLDLDRKRVIDLRRVDAPDVARQIDSEAFPRPVGDDGLDAYLRPDPAGRPAVLDLRPAAADRLLRKLGTRLTELGQQAAAEFGPAGLAVQLVNMPRRQLITRAGAPR
ncbi:hypothetical protein SSP35_21_00800 [Streptomyces sp. NBRC 110611]|uniref:hypothetical protein n=1 Tax=Streptomyces sp. NBRC 110611 TaxID=1621259 RepID=UPI0008341520|nr:hypothetical protein [Streptomyces sp. NBRC 110611]GAU70685.1 hypothetical protein SSP35_21_00800 [Streptomyces sp. NBRC 110611]